MWELIFMNMKGKMQPNEFIDWLQTVERIFIPKSFLEI
jgi:hypothetical protein